jgi:hypothetical protein
VGPLTLFVVSLPHWKIFYLRFCDTGVSDTFVWLLGLQAPNGESEMSSFGDRLFVSTSLALFLLTVTATLADPTGAGIDATKRVQDTGRSLAETGSERATTRPLDFSDEAEAPSLQTMAPSELAKLDESTGQPKDPTSNTAPTSTRIEPETIPGPPTVIDVDAPIAEQLRNLANGKFDRIISNKKEKPSIEAFYAARNYAPLWITEGSVNARSAAAIGYLGQVDADGLDSADYPVPNFASLSDPAALAEAEIRLTASVVSYAHHAQIGRVPLVARECRHLLRYQGAGAGYDSHQHL